MASSPDIPRGIRAPDRERVREFGAMLRPYQGPDTRRSVTQLVATTTIFFALWAAMLASLEVGYWLTLLLAVPTAGFLMRLFMIQHDCGHGSFFRSRRARDWVGAALGVLTLTPYHYWRKAHAYHHAHSGDLDFRGFGDVDTLTVAEYLRLPWYRRVAYRTYRHPVVFLGIGPVVHFLVKHRYPWDIPRDWTMAWRSVWWTNAALVVLVVAVSWAVGWQRLVLVHLPVLTMATAGGVWLFYVQHQFEDTYWYRHEDWDYYDAALHGSSHLVLPRPLQWVTASIGLHHVHHLSSRIPNYRLQECMDANPELQGATRLRFRDTFRLLALSLWDEESERLIGFRELGRRAAPATPTGEDHG